MTGWEKGFSFYIGIWGIGILLTKIIHHCKNETTHLIGIVGTGSKQLHDPRGWGNVIFKEEKLWKRLSFG
jgi:hypothetical protein